MVYHPEVPGGIFDYTAVTRTEYPFPFLNERIAGVFYEGTDGSFGRGVSDRIVLGIGPSARIQEVICAFVFEHPGTLGDGVIFLFPPAGRTDDRDGRAFLKDSG